MIAANLDKASSAGLASLSETIPAAIKLRDPLRYDIEADWHLLNTCNYRCAYCFFPPGMLGEKLRTHADVEQWRLAFARTGLTWLLHFTGGEPSIYPGFAQLCATLAERHYLSLNTNLTHHSMLAFAEQVPPARVSFINAGLHPHERGCKDGWPQFLRHAEALLSRRFPLIVSVVATPEVLGRFDALVTALRPIGMVPVPKLLRGKHNDRIYPWSYTADDRSRFRAAAALARASYGPMLDAMSERPTIDPFDDDAYLDGPPSFKGKLCGAGRTFVRINADGTVFRCSNTLRLGSLLEGTMDLQPAPTPCDTNYCYYFCRKHALKNERATSSRSA